MMQHIKRNVFFFLTLLTSLICFSLLWVFVGFGIAFGTFFIYQGLLMVLPISEVSIEKRLRFQFLLTGLVIGPIYTAIYAFICLGYIFDYQVLTFNDIMGFSDSQLLLKIAFVEYSIALAVNVIYLVSLFISQKRLLQSTQLNMQLQMDNNVYYRSNLHNASNESRNNQGEQIGNQDQNQNNANGGNINSSNNLVGNNNNNHANRNFRNVYIFNNGEFQNIINFHDNQNENIQRMYRLVYENQMRQFQIQQEQDRNLSSLEEEEDEDSFYLNGQYYFRVIKIDEERQDTLKTTVCSRDAQSQDEGKECAICYEEFDKIKSVNDKRLIQLTCSHTFHATCIRHSVQSIGLKCPYCRQKITQKISKCKQPSQINIRFQDFIAIND